MAERIIQPSQPVVEILGTKPKLIEITSPTANIIEVAKDAQPVVEVTEDSVHVIEVAHGVGTPGPEGPQGPAGDDGSDGHSAYDLAVMGGFQGTLEEWLFSLGGDPSLVIFSHVHRQTTPAATWIIEHPLGFVPNVSVADSAGTVVFGDVTYLDNQTIRVTFMSGFSGIAYLS